MKKEQAQNSQAVQLAFLKQYWKENALQSLVGLVVTLILALLIAQLAAVKSYGVALFCGAVAFVVIKSREVSQYIHQRQRIAEQSRRREADAGMHIPAEPEQTDADLTEPDPVQPEGAEQAAGQEIQKAFAVEKTEKAARSDAEESFFSSADAAELNAEDDTPLSDEELLLEAELSETAPEKSPSDPS